MPVCEDHRRRAPTHHRRPSDILDDPGFDYVVPSPTSLNLIIGGEHFPLGAVGTGTEQVILLVAAAIVYGDRLVCLEEPDAHLHPRLQRKVAQALRSKSSGKVVVATHSAHWIDASLDNVLSVVKDNGVTSVERLQDPALFLTLASLGYRASDLLQANCVIWVEGPSDRIYVNHWLGLEFREGIEYSIMFFGGSLLRHLQAIEEPLFEPPELVDLWRINQRMWLIVDSDRAEAGAPLKQHVTRLQEEIASSKKGGVWVTMGRTIENYVPPDLLEAAVTRVHSTVISIDDDGSSDLLTRCKTRNGGFLKSVDKPAVARVVSETKADFGMLDLKERIDDIRAFIRESNQ